MVKNILRALGIVLSLALPVSALEVGDRAPDFTAESTAGTIRLSDFLGQKNVVLSFYFADFTPV